MARKKDSNDRKIIVCKSCGKSKKHAAKGLCRTCYKREGKPKSPCVECGRKAINEGGGLCPACWMKQRRGTKYGFVSKIYSSMKKRSRERGWVDIVDKDFFMQWALEGDEFGVLWEEWIKSGREYRMVPSIDRIDNSRGYVSDNIQFLTLSDNDKKKRDDYSDTGMRIKIVKDGHTCYFRSLTDGSRYLGRHDYYLSRYMSGAYENPPYIDVKKVSHSEYMENRGKDPYYEAPQCP